jgi:hypothetical protein
MREMIHVTSIKKAGMLTVAVVGLSASVLTSGGAVHAATTTDGLTAAQQQRLTNIQTKGNEEIERRLASLNTILGKISQTTKLSSSDQMTLSNEVNTEINGLNSLKSQLDSATTVAAAGSDAQSIINEYRVYALVLPKVWLVSTADGQQVTGGKLTTLAGKLQTRISADQTAGKNASTIQTLQSELNDMTTQTNNAQAISSNMESTVITLQPTDYDSDHTILSGDRQQLQTAANDNKAAYTDAQNIINTLKTL